MRDGQHRRIYLGDLLVLLLVVAGIVTAIIWGIRTAELVPEVLDEQSRTPTPSPVYGSVMVITPDPAATATPAVLKNGSIGEEVTQLQARLALLGYYAGEIDGQFGNGTRDAVILFQRQNGLNVDGAAGPETMSVLYSAAARPYTQSPEPTATPEPTAPPAAAVPPSSGRKPYVRADGLPLLVNKEHHLAENYAPLDLVELNAYCDSSVVKIKYSDTWAEREAADALMVMLRAAVQEGVTNWQISAAYRTKSYQQQLLDKQIRTYMNENGLSRSKAETAALKVVALPGTSEHHLGTCFDITVPGVAFRGTKQHKWLAANCWTYGFILRYAEDKEHITGFNAEAWHYRYVGVEHAMRMFTENLCLEEYLEKYGDDAAVILE